MNTVQSPAVEEPTIELVTAVLRGTAQNSCQPTCRPVCQPSYGPCPPDNICGPDQKPK